MAQAARFGHEVLGVPSGSHLIDPGFQAGQDMTAHLQATQRLPLGHGVTVTGRTCQDVYATYTGRGFTLMITEVRTYATVLHRGGVVITGTDSPLVPPAVSTHIALRSLIKGGMTAAEALRTATLLPARTWGVDRDLGTLQPGKLADLAVIAGDPFGAYPKPTSARTAADWRATAATLRGGGCCSHLLPALHLT